jgi:hypothetical protein
MRKRGSLRSFRIYLSAGVVSVMIARLQTDETPVAVQFTSGGDTNIAGSAVPRERIESPSRIASSRCTVARSSLPWSIHPFSMGVIERQAATSVARSGAAAPPRGGLGLSHDGFTSWSVDPENRDRMAVIPADEPQASNIYCERASLARS